MNSWPGFFVVFEGADSVGKSTILHQIARTMLPGRPKWCPSVTETQEPTNSLIGKKIRELLQEGVPSKDLLNLFLEDRKIHVDHVILPALSAGELVLCDRYKYSTVAYQALQGHPIEKLVELNQSFPVPDVTFILYLDDPEEVRRRLKREDQTVECFDNFHWFWRVQRNYKQMPTFYPWETFILLDVSLSVEELTREVLWTIKGMLEAKRKSSLES